MTLRLIACLLVLACALPAQAASIAAKPQGLKLEKVIDSATFIASGHKIDLWGVSAIPPKNRYALASRLYLQSMLTKGKLTCLEVKNGQGTSHCRIDNGDIASLLVQMGMATAEGPYYKGEEAKARSRLRGVWKAGGTPL
jgi:endonuclease YncB( thermonuclease family)